MKKILLTSIVIVTSLVTSWSQTTEIISMGNLYANQVFYSLDNGEVSNVSNTDWDLAFSASGQGSAGSAILINEATTRLWAVPQDSSFWSVFDTAGFWAWEELLNSDTSWTNGAFNKYRGANGSFFDMGWGVLNPSNNYWTLGDSLYLVKLSNQSYKKLKINSLKQGVWEFQYADIDGKNKQVITINKANYSDRNFIYHSLSSNQTIDREPANTSWDFTLLKHRDELMPGLIMMPVTSIFTNRNLWTAKSNEVDFASASVAVVPQTAYNQNVINIGREWKKFSKGVGTVYDSIAYFLHRDNESQVYRIVFTDFGWSATGTATCEFTKLGLEGVDALSENESVNIYPNPTEGENVTIVFGEVKTMLSTIEVLNTLGEIILIKEIDQGVSSSLLNVSQLKSGLYFINLKGETTNLIKKLVIR